MNYSNQNVLLKLLLSVILVLAGNLHAQQLAFPSAEGMADLPKVAVAAMYIL